MIRRKLGPILSELYAAVIVFTVKACSYFKARGTFVSYFGYIECRSIMLNQDQG